MSTLPVVAPWPGPPFGDGTAGFSGLLAGYHLHTESGKGHHVATATELPARYRAEVDDPAGSFARDTVLLGWLGERALPGDDAQPGDDALPGDDAQPGGCPDAGGPAAAAAEPSGCVVLSGAGELKRLWVEPAARRHGLGSALVRGAADAAVARGFTVVRATVWEWSTSALALLQREGFTRVDPWDTRPGLVALRSDLPAPSPATTTPPGT